MSSLFSVIGFIHILTSVRGIQKLIYLVFDSVFSEACHWALPVYTQVSHGLGYYVGGCPHCHLNAIKRVKHNFLQRQEIEPGTYDTEHSELSTQAATALPHSAW